MRRPEVHREEARATSANAGGGGGAPFSRLGGGYIRSHRVASATPADSSATTATAAAAVPSYAYAWSPHTTPTVEGSPKRYA